jgi:hypothetical protein
MWIDMYLLFASDNVPDGGWNDFAGVYSTLKDALEDAHTYKWAQIVELPHRKVWELKDNIERWF